MKCPCVNVFYPKGKKGKFRKEHVLAEFAKDLPEGARVESCEGVVAYTAEAVDEPSWGSSYAKLEENFYCSVSNSTLFTFGHEAWTRWLPDHLRGKSHQEIINLLLRNV